MCRKILGTILVGVAFWTYWMGGSTRADETLLNLQPALSTPSGLQLNEILESVERHYPLVRMAIREQEKAQGDYLSSKGGFDPVLKSVYQNTPSGEYENRYFDTVIEQPTPLWGTKVYVGYRNGQGSFAPYDQNLVTANDGQVRGGLEVPLLRGGVIDERRAKITSTEKALEVSYRSLDLQKIDSRKQARQRYFDWIAAGEKVKVSQGLLELAISRGDILAHRITKGDAAKIEQTDNQRTVLQREAGLVAAKRAFEKASLELSLFYRNEVGQPLLVGFNRLPAQGLPIPPSDLAQLPESELGIEDQLSGYLAQHPEILKIQGQIEQNDIEQRLSRNSIFPKLDLNFSLSQDLNAGNTASGITEFKAGVKLEFPLLFRAGRGKLDAALANGFKLEAQQGFVRDRLKTSLSDSLQAIAAAKKRIKMIESEVLYSVQVEDAERTKLKHGDSNILLVNLREQSTADARMRSIEALNDYHRAYADLEAITARTLD